MFQVVVQSAMRQLKARLKLRHPLISAKKKHRKKKIKIEQVLFWPCPLAVEYCCWPCFPICQTAESSDVANEYQFF